MATRSYTDVAPTAATIALNAYIFGYGGHSLVTPHAALKQLWWTDERIERKITRAFVVSKLRGEEREFLDRPLAFGEGLTDDTYMEWMLERAKRLFLILTMIGVPDQIFGCIDDSWDDDDLPIPLENVKNLGLSYEIDEVLNKKFYDTQFVYLLREIGPGAHIDYGLNEHIPMEYVNTLPPAVSLQAWDRVHFPGRPGDIYSRRKYALTDKETGHDHRDSFMRDVKKARNMQHEHIANVWASYTSEDAGYVLSDFVGEHTLGTFIDHRTPVQLMRVPAAERPALLYQWMHCLADALASIHHRGVAHTAIRPSNIIVNYDNHIAFADIGSLRTFQKGKRAHKTETYDYAAPESQLCRDPLVLASSPPVSSMSAFSRLRKMSTSGSSSSASSSNGSSTRSSSMCTTATGSPVTPPCGRTNSITTITATTSPGLPPPRMSSNSFLNFSRHLQHEACPSPSIPKSPKRTTNGSILPQPTYVDPDTLRDLPEATPEMSDIYSFGCVLLDILTFILKGRTTDFVKLRSTRLQTANNKNKFRTDHSFHSNIEKIDEWIKILNAESERLGSENQIYRGVPELLKLVRKMMAQNGALRPSAQDIRDRIEEVLFDQCGIKTLCCAGRVWNVPAMSEDIDGGPVRDSCFIAPATLKPPPRVGSACGDYMSVLSRVESFASAKISTTRRRSSASIVSAKVGAWKRAFSRAA